MSEFVIAALLAGLGSDDFAARERASLGVWACGQCGWQGPARAALAHPDAEVRRRGADALDALLHFPAPPGRPRPLHKVVVPPGLEPLRARWLVQARLRDDGLGEEYRQTDMTFAEYDWLRGGVWRGATLDFAADAVAAGWPPLALLPLVLDPGGEGPPPPADDHDD